MDPDPLADVVSGQYERWSYPAPIEDLPDWLRTHWEWFDPSHSHRLLWPDRDYPSGLDILVAGCGTNQAAVIAYTNPSAHVVGIDVSTTSLGHQRRLAQTHGLGNLDLHHLPIEEAGALGRDFDLIITTGVLHHLADPAAGMRSLASLLRRDAVLAVMLYGVHGRIGVQLLQSVFRDLGLTQNDFSVSLVRRALAAVGDDHPVASYLPLAPDLVEDAGIVDTFLHGRERAYTIDECRELVTSAGLEFMDLFLRAPYYAPRSTGNEFLDLVSMLPRELQWSVMERVSTRNACHFFMACRADRPRQAYEIDFASGDPMRFVPALRHACRHEGMVLRRFDDWPMVLDADQASLVSLIDGLRSIKQIIEVAGRSGVLANVGSRQTQGMVVDLFESLWRLDLAAMGLPPHT